MKNIIKFFVCICIFSFSFPFAYSAEEETLIIFDASVSMLDDFYGQPKYITAISEAKSVLDRLSSSRKIGLRTIGVTFDAALLAFIKNPSELCKSTQLVAPIRQNNVEYIKNSLDGIFPLGTTPLTYTLDMAINYDFTKSAQLKHIILITDGGESCNGDPCKYIREIMALRSDIRIDIIAIGVNADDFKQLKCLTDSTYGTIVNVAKPDELKSAFSQFLSPDLSSISDSIKYNNKIKKENITYKNYLIETYE